MPGPKLLAILLVSLGVASAAAAAIPSIPSGLYKGTARRVAPTGSGGTYQFSFHVTGAKITGIAFSKVAMSCSPASGASDTSVIKLVTFPGGLPAAAIHNGFLFPVYVYAGGRWKILPQSQRDDGKNASVTFSLAYDFKPKHWAASVEGADLNLRAYADANGTFNPKGTLVCIASSSVTLAKA